MSLRPISQSQLENLQECGLLGVDGRLTSNLKFDTALLKKMYESMVLARTFDEKAINISTFREIGAYAPFSGQEAVQIGAAYAMGDNDWLVPTFRDDAFMIARGVPMEKVLQYWSGDEFGMKLDPRLHVLPFTIPVATQVTHATGLALSLKKKNSESAVIVTVGDGGTSKGDFHEGVNMAAVYDVRLLVAVENNQYAISVPRSKQTKSTTLAQKSLAYGIDGLTVDGNDILAVYNSVKFALEKIKKESVPMLIEFNTYRLRMHTTAELVSAKKRAPEEVEAWKERDPIERVERYLRSIGELDDDYKQKVKDAAKETVNSALAAFRNLPRPDPKSMFEYLCSDIPSHLAEQYKEMSGEQLSTENEDTTENIPLDGPEMNMRNSINLALKQALADDERVLIFGEDVGKNGGVFQVTRGLQEQFGENRVFDTPLSEAGIAGLFVGLSIGGYTPVAEFQFDGFVPPAYDQIINHIARYRNRTRGGFTLNGVLRFPFGGGVNGLEHHSDSPEVYLASTPGLKVVVPSNPRDAKGLLMSAIEGKDPVIFMEPKRLYDAPKMPVSESKFTIPIGKAKVLTEGDDVTILTYGAMVYPALDAAKDFSAEVIDLRTLSPLDMSTIRKSFEKTGRLVIVHEAQRMCGIGAEISARIAEKSLDYLKAPIRRVTGYDVIVPTAKLEEEYRPNAAKIKSAIKDVLAY